jgi:RNA polymerase sigma-70 factor (ECF subfamily)
MEIPMSGMSTIEYNKMYEAYKDRFIRFAMSYLGELSAAEDIVMEAFMMLWQRRNEITFKEAPAYTLTSIKNKCLNELRNAKSHHNIHHQIAEQQERIQQLRISSLDACDPKELLAKEMHETLQLAISKMSNKTKEIFIRSRFKEESYKEISMAMECSVKSVEYELSKALKFLRKELREYFPVWIFFM